MLKWRRYELTSNVFSLTFKAKIERAVAGLMVVAIVMLPRTDRHRTLQVRRLASRRKRRLTGREIPDVRLTQRGRGPPGHHLLDLELRRRSEAEVHRQRILAD